MTDWLTLHRQHTVNRTQQIRDRGLFSDVTVRVEGVHFRCHRFLLAASSDFFLKHFTPCTSPGPRRAAATDLDNTLSASPGQKFKLTSGDIQAQSCYLEPTGHVNEEQKLRDQRYAEVYPLVTSCREENNSGCFEKAPAPAADQPSQVSVVKFQAGKPDDQHTADLRIREEVQKPEAKPKEKERFVGENSDGAGFGSQDIVNCPAQCNTDSSGACGDVTTVSFASGKAAENASKLEPRCAEEIEVDFVTAEVFRIILDALYLDRDPVTDQTAVSLLKAAGRLQIPSLVQHCENAVLDLLHKSKISALELIMDPEMAVNGKIARASLDILLSDFGPETCKTEWFLGLSRQNLLSVLEDPRLNVRDEDEVYRALTKWYEHDPASREQFLAEALDKIRLVNLSRRVLVEKVLRHAIFPDEVAAGKERSVEGDGTRSTLFQQVQRALAYHLLPDRRHEEALRHAEFRPSQACERVLLVMGDQSDKLYAYSLARQAWFKLTGPPQPLGLGIAACTHGDDVYVTGGGKAMTSCWRYRPSTNAWKQMTDMTVGRRSHACVAVGDAIFVLGGKDDRRPLHRDSLDSIETFQVHRKAEGWREVGVSLPVPIRSMATGVVGDKIYLMGGRTNGFQRTLSVVQCFDTVSLQCCVVSHLPQPSCLARPFFAHKVLHILDTNGDVLRFRPCCEEPARAGGASKITTAGDDEHLNEPQLASGDAAADISSVSQKESSAVIDLAENSVNFQEKQPSNVSDGHSGSAPEPESSRNAPEEQNPQGEHVSSNGGVISELYSAEKCDFVKVGCIKNLNWKWFGAARNYDGTVYVIAGQMPQKAAPPTLTVDHGSDESVFSRVKLVRPEQMEMCYMDLHACVPKAYLLEKVV
ncbi:hypothetical protein BaRGS_00039484 [Batillaria attramentaria]|uniref:BTB domain-containing protein n=1 Tax=Batillaria attramentaria TaxID=370345 RepID=A0ABD0J3M5_9CAEN